MALELGTKRRVRPQVNVTPLVDVVLVLLIIFMVITPLMNKHFWVHIPKEDKQAAADPIEQTGPTPLVLTVNPQGTIKINGREVAEADFPTKLRRIFAARDDRVLFFDAVNGTKYWRAVKVLDLARENGATTIAILTDALAQ